MAANHRPLHTYSRRLQRALKRRRKALRRRAVAYKAQFVGLEPLESRVLLNGVTLLTHGFQADSSDRPAWIDTMAGAIITEAGADTAVYALQIARNVEGNAQVDSFAQVYGPAQSSGLSSNGQSIVMLDWADASGMFLSYFNTADIASLVVPFLESAIPAVGIVRPLAESAIHLVGHSRGGSLVSELAKDLGENGIWVDQLTTLDPHPVLSDPDAITYDNVVFADNYYETFELFTAGAAVAGAHNSHLSGGVLHSDVHAWYHGTIDTTAGTDGTGRAISSSWYNAPNPGPRTSVGFDWSAIGGSARPLDGVSVAFGGTATRTATSQLGSQWSNIGDVHVTDGRNLFTIGESIPLSFMYQDRDDVGLINFYLDDDQNPYNGNVGTITPASLLTPFSGDSVGWFSDVASDTSTISAGNYYLYGEVADDQGHTRYAYDSAIIQLVEPPTVIEGLVFADLDANGIRDPLDSVADAVTVRLLSAAGAEIDSRAVDAGGGFQFSGIDPGDYILEFAPDDATLSPTFKNALFGGKPLVTLDSDVNRTTFRTDVINLANGTTQVRDLGLLNARPDVDDGAEVTIDQGDNVDLLAAFRDIDSGGNFTVTIDWGDGNVDELDSEDHRIIDPTLGGGAGDLMVTIDYSLDTSNFFDSQIKRDVLQYAVSRVFHPWGDTLAAIVPGGSNQWQAVFANPSTGDEQRIDNLTIAENEIVLYVGADDLGGTTVGEGGPGGWWASGSPGFVETVLARDQQGAEEDPYTDVSIWGGRISFDQGGTSQPDWYFGVDPAGQGANQTDFLSVALHEMFHVAGFGTEDAFDNLISGGTFIGPHAQAEHGGPIPLFGDLSHWAGGTQSGGREAALDPSLTKGTRKLETPLDVAALDDIGWELLDVAAADGQINASHQYFATGQFDVLITVEDADGHIGTATKTMHVNSVAPTGSISGIKFDDLDGDGERDPGEPGLDGVTIQLLDADDDTTILDEQLTAGGGMFAFNNLPPGRYLVREVTPDGRVQTISGLNDFGFERATVFDNVDPLLDDDLATVFGDFDGDGDIDFIAASVNVTPLNDDPVLAGEQTTLVLRPNQTDGTFDEGRNFDVDGQLHHIAAGDLNGDGLDDLAALVSQRDPFSGAVTREIAVLLSNGDGTFHRIDVGTLPANHDPRDIVLGDLDGDNDLDMAVLSRNANDAPYTSRIDLYRNNGDARFDSARVIAASDGDAFDLQIGEITGDTRPDIVLGGQRLDIDAEYAGYVRVLENSGGFNFTNGYFATFGETVQQIELADVTGDGRVDAIVHERNKQDIGTPDDRSDLRLLTNDGNDGFSLGLATDAGRLLERIALGDFSGDGHLDIAAIDNDPLGILTIFIGDGAGNFDDHGMAEHETKFDFVANSLAVTDLDGDGDADVLITASGVAVVAINQAAYNFILGADETRSDLVFGNHAIDMVTIAGRKFLDLDGDGEVDPGETGLNDVTVDLIDLLTGEVVATRQTQSLGSDAGHYSFDDVLPGAYAVREGGIDGYVQTAPAGRGFGTPVVLDDLPRTVDDGAIADVDGDGDKDIVTAARIDGTNLSELRIVYNRGDGTFTGSSTTIIEGQFDQIAAGDFDADGDDDIVALYEAPGGAGTYNFQLAVLLSNRDGTFSRLDDVGINSNAKAQFIAVGNLDGDATPDVAVAASDDVDGQTIVYLNNGAGVLAEDDAFATDGNALAIAIGDIDGDGDNDVVAGGERYDIGEGASVGFVRVMRNNANNSFTRQSQVELNDPVADLFIGDVNADAAGDLFMHMRRESFGSPGSLLAIALSNGNLTFDIDNIEPVDAHADFNDVVAGDFNGDGVLDLATVDAEGAGGFVTTFIAQANGRLILADSLELQHHGSVVAAGDFDGDGDDDLIISGDLASAPMATIVPIVAAHRVIMTEGAVRTDLHFCNYRVPTGSISGHKFLDIDGDGTQDAGEPGLDGLTIEAIDKHTGQVLGSSVTAGGDFVIDGLYAGEYLLREVGADGLRGTTPAPLEPVLYAAAARDGQVDAINELFLIDSATGAAVRLGEIGFDLVTGLAFLPDGRLIGSATFGGQRVLIDIDPHTGVGTSIGTLPQALRDLSYDSTTGTLFGHGANNALYAVNPDTAAAVNLGATGFVGDGRGLAADSAGTLFATSGNNFLSLDKADGDGTLRGATTPAVRAMDFDPATGVLFAAVDPVAGADVLVTINPATGAAHVIAITVQGIDAIAFAAAGTPGIAGLVHVSLAAGQNVQGMVIGNEPLGELGVIEGQTFSDINGNAAHDVDEPGLNRVTVELLDPNSGQILATTATANQDRNHDGTIDPITERGWFSFNYLLPGDYIVREVEPPGYTQTFPGGDGAHAVVIEDIDSVVVVNFGNDPNGVGSIHGTKFADRNGNGMRDLGESAIAGVTIYLDTLDNDQFDDGIDPSTITAADGSYSFELLAPGDYDVREVVPDGYAQSAPGDPQSGEAGHAVTVLEGRPVEDVDFANVPLTAVVDRHMFYNRSGFDGGNAQANEDDDGAIASDKQTLLPGAGQATIANYTNYSRGINGVMIDIHGIADPMALGADDFIFKVGNDDAPGNWLPAPVPVSIMVREEQGTDGSDRVTLIWDDYAIEDQWLEVTVKATTRTGLVEPNVAYFGNAIGDVNGDGFTGLDDALRIWANRRIPGVNPPAPIDDHYDINRDGWVGLDDALLAWANRKLPGTHPGLRLIDIPAQLADESSAPPGAGLIEVEAENETPAAPSRRLAALLWRLSRPAEASRFTLRGVSAFDDGDADAGPLTAMLKDRSVFPVDMIADH
jgi:hypothetical protein